MRWLKYTALMALGGLVTVFSMWALTSGTAVLWQLGIAYAAGTVMGSVITELEGYDRS